VVPPLTSYNHLGGVPARVLHGCCSQALPPANRGRCQLQVNNQPAAALTPATGQCLCSKADMPGSKGCDLREAGMPCCACSLCLHACSNVMAETAIAAHPSLADLVLLLVCRR
jgi:hypothetical protein